MPARNGETDSSESPFGWVEVERDDLRVHPNWLNNGQLDFDYGAIILPEDSPLGSQTGFFGFGHFNNQDLDESAPTLSGYPDDEPEGGKKTCEACGGSGKSATRRLFRSDCPRCDGRGFTIARRART